MNGLSKATTRPQPTMNVTPLVDVVLVLLIIFMVVLPMLEKSAPVELPQVHHADADAKGKTDPFSLSLTVSGALYFENEPLDRSSFARRLREENRRDPARRLVLRADRAARYGDVRKLFKECQEIGFPGVSLRVHEKKRAVAP